MKPTFYNCSRFSFTSIHTMTVAMLFVAMAWLNPSPVIAQTTCTYSVKMFDSFGDGWSGGVLTVVSNGVTTTHTLLTGSSGTSSFQVVDGAPISITYAAGSFPTEVGFDILDSDGVLIYTGGPVGAPAPATGLIFQGVGHCPNCKAPNVNLVAIFDITDSSAHINWLNSVNADYYLVEYGPAGFPIGEGILFDTTSSSADLFELNPCVTYDVYIAAVCGQDSVSVFVGPYTFTTLTPPSPPGDTCTFTLKLFDSFGDGWNGSFLTVEQGGVATNYGMTSGSAITYTINATSNTVLHFSYTAGAFQNEVTYQILGLGGEVLFEDGPNPATGQVFSTVACPTCPGPLDFWISDVNATNANVSWINLAGFQNVGDYVIEYGPMGFTLGTGTADTVAASTTSHQLNNLAENTWYNVYIRRSCDSTQSKATGPLMFKTRWLNDIGITVMLTPNADSSCYFGVNDTVTIGITNFGQLPQTLFGFDYAVNGQLAGVVMPQDGLYTNVVGNDSTNFIAFETTYDFSQPGVYVIQAWTLLDGDAVLSNDTFTFILQTAYPKPLSEDFEDNAVPDTWVHDGIIFAPDSHNNPTYVLSDNLFADDKDFTLTTQRAGPIETGDTLYFDYRYVNWSAGTIPTSLGPNDRLEVQVSTDCEESWQTIHVIDVNNHVPTTELATVAVDLSAFADSALTFRFAALWGQGDYWLDIDNINLPGCPPSLNLFGNTSPSIAGDSTGSVQLTLYSGTSPYSFVWVNELGDTVSTQQHLTQVPAGNYTVIVEDANGCTDSRGFSVDAFTNAGEVYVAPGIVLYPNPSSGEATLDLKMERAAAALVRLVSMSGQVVYTAVLPAQPHQSLPISLQNLPDGMYALQIVVEGRAYVTRVVLMR